MNSRELPEKWRAEADAYEHDGVPYAKLLRRVADELEHALTEWGLEALPPARAGAYSGYSQSQLRRLAAEGKIRNVGGKGRPRYVRADLPRKSGTREDRPGEPDLVAGVIGPAASLARLGKVSHDT